MNISFYDALRVAEEVPSIGRSLSKIDGFVTFIQSLKSKAEAYTVTELLEEVIDLTGYVDELKAEDTEESRARIENIDELISKTVSYQETMEAEQREATLSGFLEEIALIADIDSVEAGSGLCAAYDSCTVPRGWNFLTCILQEWKMAFSPAVCAFFQEILPIWKKNVVSAM